MGRFFEFVKPVRLFGETDADFIGRVYDINARAKEVGYEREQFVRRVLSQGETTNPEAYGDIDKLLSLLARSRRFSPKNEAFYTDLMNETLPTYESVEGEGADAFLRRIYQDQYGEALVISGRHWNKNENAYYFRDLRVDFTVASPEALVITNELTGEQWELASTKLI